MTCKKCNQPLVVEDLGENKKRYICKACGLNEIRDEKGRQLLTGEMPAPTANVLLS